MVRSYIEQSFLLEQNLQIERLWKAQFVVFIMALMKSEVMANLVAVEAQKRTAAVANTVAAAMGVASMVVGQYYMTQINERTWCD